jgi:hypothetical protein
MLAASSGWFSRIVFALQLDARASSSRVKAFLMQGAHYRTIQEKRYVCAKHGSALRILMLHATPQTQSPTKRLSRLA